MGKEKKNLQNPDEKIFLTEMMELMKEDTIKMKIKGFEYEVKAFDYYILVNMLSSQIINSIKELASKGFENIFDLSISKAMEPHLQRIDHILGKTATNDLTE